MPQTIYHLDLSQQLPALAALEGHARNRHEECALPLQVPKSKIKRKTAQICSLGGVACFFNYDLSPGYEIFFLGYDNTWMLLHMPSGWPLAPKPGQAVLPRVHAGGGWRRPCPERGGVSGQV